MSRRAVVLGVGNPLYGDDGFGVAAVAALRESGRWGAEVELVDGGTEGLGLLGYVEDATHLLILDAVQSSEAPGTVVEYDAEALSGGTPLRLSQHQVGVADVLSLAVWRGRLPANSALLGVAAGRMEVGCGLSEPVAAALPRVLDRAAQVLAGWGIAPAR